MAINFPTSIDTFANLDCDTTDTFADVVNDVQDAVEALETKVGVDGSAVNSSLDYLLKNTSSSNPGHKHTLVDGATDVTSTAAELNILDGVTADATEINYLDGATPGTAVANKALIVDGSKDIDLDGGDLEGANITSTGTLTINDVAGNWDWWASISETFTYASATTVTVASGAASRFSRGDKIKLTNSTVKYFYITRVQDTVLTLFAGSSYTLANAAISAISVSRGNPVDFPKVFAYTITWGGYSTDPAGSDGRFWIDGGLCYVNIAGGNGTSNANTNTATLPLPILTGTGYSVRGATAVRDNGTDFIDYYFVLDSQPTIVNFVKAGSASGWTSSGSKRGYLTSFFQYEVT